MNTAAGFSLQIFSNDSILFPKPSALFPTKFNLFTFNLLCFLLILFLLLEFNFFGSVSPLGLETLLDT